MINIFIECILICWCSVTLPSSDILHPIKCNLHVLISFDNDANNLTYRDSWLTFQVPNFVHFPLLRSPQRKRQSPKPCAILRNMLF
jgi:hypothetical protein